MAGEMFIGPGSRIMGTLDTSGMDPRIRRNFQRLKAAGLKLPYWDNLEVNADGQLQVKVMDRVDDIDGEQGMNLLFDALQDVSLMDSWWLVDESANNIVDENGNYIIG